MNEPQQNGACSGEHRQRNEYLQKNDLCRRPAEYIKAKSGYTTLAGKRFVRLNFGGSDFSGEDLRGVRFIGCELGGASFENADLRNAVIFGCNCFSTDFTSSILEGSVLSLTSLSLARFDHANLSNARFFFSEISSTTSFFRANLETVRMSRQQRVMAIISQARPEAFVLNEPLRSMIKYAYTPPRGEVRCDV